MSFLFISDPLFSVIHSKPLWQSRMRVVFMACWNLHDAKQSLGNASCYRSKEWTWNELSDSFDSLVIAFCSLQEAFLEAQILAALQPLRLSVSSQLNKGDGDKPKMPKMPTGQRWTHQTLAKLQLASRTSKLPTFALLACLFELPAASRDDSGKWVWENIIHLHAGSRSKHAHIALWSSQILQKKCCLYTESRFKACNLRTRSCKCYKSHHRVKHRPIFLSVAWAIIAMMPAYCTQASKDQTALSASVSTNTCDKTDMLLVFKVTLYHTESCTLDLFVSRAYQPEHMPTTPWTRFLGSECHTSNTSRMFPCFGTRAHTLDHSTS